MKQRTKDWIDGVFVAVAFGVLLFMSINAWACTAFYTGERISGMNKLCYFNHLGSDVVLTVRSIDLCPITVTWPH